MAEGLLPPNGVWAGFKSTVNGGDLNRETEVRRRVYSSANELEEEQEEIVIPHYDTLKLFDPAARIVDPRNRQATIGPVTQEVKAEAKPEERPKVSIEQFKQTQPGFLASPIMGVIEKLVPDAQSQIVGGITDAFSNTIEGLGIVLGEDKETGLLRNLSNKVLEIEKSDRFAANLTRGIAQFSTVFIPGVGISNRVLQGASVTTKAVAGEVVVGGLADFFAFKGKDKRLADMLVEQFPGMKEWPFIGSLLEYVEGNPDDTEAEGRWKNVVEGQILNGLTGAITNPKQTAKQFFRLTQQVQKINHLSKYMNNELGAIGEPFTTREIIQGKGRIAQQQVELASRIEEPAKRLKATKQAMRAVSVSEEQVRRMADEANVPLEDLNNLLKHGESRPIADQAALVGTIREVNKEIKSISEEMVKNPFKDEPYLALDAKLDELSKIYATYVGSGSEAGARLNAQKMLNGVLQESGLEKTLQAIEAYKLSTRDEKLLFAQRMKGISDKETGRFVKNVGAQLRTGKPFQSAIAEAYIGTRFTPLSVAKNVAANAIFTNGLIAERAIASVVGPKDSPITFKESVAMAHGIYSSIGTAFRAYLDQSFNPGMNPVAVAMNSKFDSFTPAIIRDALNVSNKWAGGMLDAIGHLVRFFPNQMNATDEAFKTMLRQGELQALSYREALAQTDDALKAGLIQPSDYAKHLSGVYKSIIKDPTDSLLKRADEFAHYATFTDSFDENTALGNLAQSYQRVTNEYPMIKLLFPFFKTPVRISQASIKRVPVLGGLLSDTQEALASSDAERIALARAKQWMGGLVGITGIGLWSSGVLIGQGPPPTDQKGKELWEMRSIKPFSIVRERFADGSIKSAIPISEIAGPLGPVMKMMVTLGDYTKVLYDHARGGKLTREQEKAYDEFKSGVVSTLSKTFEDQVFFRNVLSILAGLGRGDTKPLDRYIAGSLTPAMSGEVAKWIDPVAKEVDSLGEMFLERIPFARSFLASKTDVLGQDYVEGVGVLEEQNPPGMVGFMSTRINPASATGNWDVTNQVIMDFQGQHAENLAGIQKTDNVGQIQLDPEQKNVYNKIRAGVDAKIGDVTIPAIRIDGSTLKERWLEVITSDNPDSIKVFSYNKWYAAYSKQANRVIRQLYPDLDREIQEVELSGKGAAIESIITGSIQ